MTPFETLVMGGLLALGVVLALDAIWLHVKLRQQRERHDALQPWKEQIEKALTQHAGVLETVSRQQAIVQTLTRQDAMLDMLGRQNQILEVMMKNAGIAQFVQANEEALKQAVQPVVPVKP